MRIEDVSESSAGPASAAGSSRWGASLCLGFSQRRGGTQLIDARHQGPLRVQRPFHPEGRDGPCHVYVLHPPGGIVAGDQLALDVHAGPATHALLTAPGATKLYRARASLPAGAASVAQRFHAESDAVIEWLPHETIAFDGAHAALETEVLLDESASYAGWEIVCLGRPAARERFTSGALRSVLTIRRGGRLTFRERARYRGGDPMLEAEWGLAGAQVAATFVVASPCVEAGWVEALRASIADTHVGEGGRFAATLVSGVLILRFLGSSTREARALFEHAHSVLRPLYAGRAAVRPRIWST